MIEEILSLGFRNIELNYNVTFDLLRTIEPMIERGDIAVSSVHNTFPFIDDPDYGTDSVLLGFDDETKRKRAVELMVRSAEYADRYGAGAVVVHPGEVPFDYDADGELKRLYADQGPASSAYRARFLELAERRIERSGVYLERISRSLEEACDIVAKRGYRVVFGIETRARFHQIPTIAESASIIDRLGGAPVGLWYDIGHGMMMERMGLYENDATLLAKQGKVAGVHIHETIGLSDHWCPYVHSGNNSYFDRFLPVIEAAPIKVYELKAACEPETIEASHRMIVEKLAVRAKERINEASRR
ncbi:sugar phosphate isomerase/epimerase [Paenibacillus phyllosphaerae]|uniref:Sugar phosphate isomerase/epimerase n=2 Tax=Paenibacillus phyllosphaerae TaxID=274593 RepID=A0A7W5AZH9_9BACL|nr:sugar phosphate isomerase/epimerase [Paenibacillus phyllosphaerae]